MGMNLNMLSEAAKTALINAEHRGQGAKVKADAVVITELFDEGMVGAEDGLTRKGTIAREKLTRALEDALFGF